MENDKCMRCGEVRDNLLPMCSKCRIELKDFPKLASFLNSCNGNKEDMIWLIKSEISDRQSLIISSSKIIQNEHGNIEIVPTDGHQFSRQKAEEITKLYRALSILKERHGQSGS